MDKLREMGAWILKHPIAFAWILTAIAILLNWFVSSKAPHTPVAGGKPAAGQHADAKGDGKGSITAHAGADGKTSAQVEAGASKAGEATAQAGAAGQQAGTTAQGVVNGAAMQGAQTGNAAAGTTVAAVTGVTSTSVTADQKTLAPAQGQVVATVDSQAAAGAAPAQGATSEGTAAQAGAAASASTTTAVSSNPNDLLRAAREAYWSQEYDRAVEFYTQLISQDANPSYKGELANVYWKMEKPEQAADLYLEIGSWLKSQGRTAEIINMKVYVDMVSPEKGKQLGTLLGQ